VLVEDWHVFALVSCCKDNDIRTLKNVFLLLRCVCSHESEFWLLIPSRTAPEFLSITPQTGEGVNDPTLAGSDSSLVVAFMIVISVSCRLGGIVNLDFITVDDLDPQMSARGIVVCAGQRGALWRGIQVEALLRVSHELSWCIELLCDSTRSVDEKPCDGEA
jgi:hypothetical protein